MSKAVPKLRFKEYGGDWRKLQLVEVFSIFNGYAFASTDTRETGCRWVKIADVGINEINHESSSFLPEEYKEKHSKYLLREGDYIVALTRPILDGKLKIARVDKVLDGSLLNQRVGKLISKNDLSFVYLLLQKQSLIARIENRIAGTDPPNLSPTEINSLYQFIPTLPEQQKIASFLSAVDEKIRQLTRKKELLEHYKKGVMQQLFCLHYDSSDSGDGHDGLSNHGNQKNHSKSQFRQLRFKDENGKAYPKWEEKRLGDVCVINPSSDEIPGSFIYIDLESVVKGHLIQERRIEKTDAPSRAQRKLLPNDILYQTVRPYQMNNYLFDRQGDYVASTGYAQIRTNQDTKYIYQLLHSEDFVNEVMERCTGTSFPAINSKDLGKIKILIPHKEEQQKIATFLSAIDAKIESVATQIEKTQTFKKGLLQQMFV